MSFAFSGSQWSGSQWLSSERYRFTLAAMLGPLHCIPAWIAFVDRPSTGWREVLRMRINPAPAGTWFHAIARGEFSRDFDIDDLVIR